MDLGNIIAKLGLDTTDFEKKMSTMTTKFNSMSKKMAITGGAMSLAVTTPLLLIGRKMTMAWDEAIQAETKLNAAILSTGGVAGKSTKELMEMSAVLQQKTTFGDDAIQGAQGLLLTFTQVRGEIYDKAIPAIMDMSTMLGQDLQSSAVLVGKALNDPIKGMTNLRRVGVSFTEEQINLTKKLVAEGKIQEAQQIILNELQVEFGGQAEAAAKKGLGPMKQMQNNLGDLMEQFGKIIVEGLTPFFNWLSKLVVKFQSLSEPTKKFIVVLASIVAAVGPLLLGLAGIVRVIPYVVQGFKAMQGAVAALNKTLMSNPYLAIAAAVLVLAIAITKYVKEGSAAEKMHKRVSAAVENTRGQVMAEQDALNKSFEALKNNNTKQDERARLIKEINERYGEYLPKLLTDKTSTIELAQAQSILNNQIAQGIILKSKNATIEEETVGILETQKEALTNIQSTLIKNGWSAAQANAGMNKLTASLRKGDTFQAAFQNSLGLTTLQVTEMAGSFDWASGKTSSLMDYMYDLSGALQDEKNVIAGVGSMYDILLNSFTTPISTPVPTGGLGDEDAPPTTALNAYQKLTKAIGDYKEQLQSLTTLAYQGNISDADAEKIPKIKKELEILEAQKKQIDESWIQSSGEVKQAFDQDLENMSKSRQEYNKSEKDLLDSQFAERYTQLDEMYKFESLMYSDNAEQKSIIDAQYYARREQLDSEYMLQSQVILDKINQENAQSYADSYEIRRQADFENLQEQMAIMDKGECAYEEYLDNRATDDESYYAYVSRLSKSSLTSQIADFKAAKKEHDKTFLEIAGEAKEAKEEKTYDFSGDSTNFITSIPDSIMVAIQSMKELKATYSDTMASLNEQWKSGSLSYQEYVDKMKEATASFEEDSKKIGFGKTIINSLAELLITVGKSVMAIGLATDAMKQAFENPYIAIAAGAAAIATGMILKSVFQGLETGGTVTKSGAFLVGESGPELVNLKAGAAVTPNHLLGASGNSNTLVTRISGRDLEIILQRTNSQTTNRRGRG